MLFYNISTTIIGNDIMQISTKKVSKREKDKSLEIKRILAHWNRLHIKLTKNWDNYLTVEEELNAQRKH